MEPALKSANNRRLAEILVNFFQLEIRQSVSWAGDHE